MQKEGWDDKSFKITHKAAHTANLIGTAIHSPNTILTSSQDRTLRLWDLRLNSSVKLIRNKCLTDQLTNPDTDGDNSVYVGSESSLYLFDARKELVFVQEVAKQTQQPHFDSLNRIKVSRETQQVVCCDDEGDIRVYDWRSLCCQHRLEQEHTNICNSIDVGSCDNKALVKKKLCVSGGFDSTVVLWDMEEEKPIKKVGITELFNKYEIKSDNQNMPFIHSLFSHHSGVVVGVETGHILFLPLYDLRKPKFILQASLSRVVCCSMWTHANKNVLVSADNADSFCLFDFEQRVEGKPKFLQKYKTAGEPVQVSGVATNIIVACASPVLSIYSLKQ